MSALAAAYAQTFRLPSPQPGLQIDSLAGRTLASIPMQTAALMSPLAQQGLAAQGNLLNTTLGNRQRTLEQDKELAYNREFNAQARKDSRKNLLSNLLLRTASGASGLGQSRGQEWALQQAFAPQGDGIARAGNRYGTALAAFEGAGATNTAAMQAYFDSLRQSGGAGAGLPVPTA